MEYVNSQSIFLMNESLFMMNESVDFTWDYKNNKKTNHNTGEVSSINNVKKKLKKSLDQSNNKLKWFDILLNKSNELSNKSQKYIIGFGILLLLSIGVSKVDILNTADGNGTELNIIPLIPSISEIDTTEIDTTEIDTTTETEVLGNFNDFKTSVAKRESGGKWNISNKHGYMGLYQIGRMALKDINRTTKDTKLKGIHKRITKKKFDKNPNIFPIELQDKCFKELLKLNKHYLRNYKSYIGKTITYTLNGETKSIKITESGMLGGAHLVGNGGVKKFLRSNGKKIPKDGNGTPVTEYLELFSNYDLKLD